MTAPSPLPSLLQSASAQALAAPVRALLSDQAEPGDPWRDAPEVVGDTLDTLALLEADGEMLAAALFAALPAAWARVGAQAQASQPGIAALVEGLETAGEVWRLHDADAQERNHEGLRKLLLAMLRDLRVVPILLATQLARMRHAGRWPQHDRRALARLTRDIHAPLANRLGIWQLKWELEDLAFRALEPDAYQRIARMLDDKRAGREAYIAGVVRVLRAALAAQGIDADVAGRPKHITSIWKKMQRKGLPIDALHDLRAVRVLVDSLPECYAALGVVHSTWAPVPGEFDDYIARPKPNGYRSLHTAVLGPEGKTLEVQLRTRAMHAAAELGVAAHWRYKEGARADDALDRKVEWMRRLLEPRTPGEGDAGGGFSEELVEDRVYVLTPRGEVLDLPAGATPLDFAYRVHTMVGHRCRGAKVDGRIVPLDTRLATGQRVQILTGKEAAPRRDWLVGSSRFLASPRSRDKVRTWFHQLDRSRNVQAGREVLERERRRLGMGKSDLGPVLARFNARDEDEFAVLLALGDVSPPQLGRALLESERPQPASAPLAAAVRARKPRAASGFRVGGVGNLMTHAARCCHPLPGDQIAGYLTQSRGVGVHRADCPALLRMAARHPQRVLPVDWGSIAGGHEAGIEVEAIDRKWLLKDLGNTIAQEEAHVIDIRTEPRRDSARLRLRLRVQVRDVGRLAQLLGKLDALPGVQSVRRS